MERAPLGKFTAQKKKKTNADEAQKGSQQHNGKGGRGTKKKMAASRKASGNENRGVGERKSN